MNNKKKIIIGILITAAAIVLIGIIGHLVYQKNQKTMVTASSDAQPESDELDNSTVIYNGQTYKLRRDIKTVLFMGVDKKNQEMLEERPVNGGQSDCMILLVMDTKNKTTKMIQISRETMVDISLYNEDGDFAGTQNAQICLQYAYGDGKTRSCWLTKQVVSSLFYNIAINNCIALNVEGLSVLTTAIGGVNIMIPQDYTVIDPSFTAGAQLNLQGDQALKYVQYRDTSVSGSNNDRMERQMQFLTALASQMKEKAGDNNWYTNMMDIANPYMVTDADAETIQQLSSYSLETEILKVPGESVAGAEHDEYHVDVDGLYQMVLDVFYEVKE
ncbi:MAG: LCP family protein [Hespellia sp.]|nr:LCP family protein [Hespellia sp.]